MCFGVYHQKKSHDFCSYLVIALLLCTKVFFLINIIIYMFIHEFHSLGLRVNVEPLGRQLHFFICPLGADPNRI